MKRNGIAARTAALLLVGAVTALGGCARTEDPARAGFFSGIGNLASGTYGERIAEREQQAQAAEADLRSLQQSSAALQAESQRLSAEEQDLRARTERLNADVTRMQQRLREAQRRRDIDRARLAELQARADDLRRRQQETEANPALQGEIARLERENRELNEQIDRMMQTGVR